MSTAAIGWIWEDSRLPLVIGVLAAFLAASLFYTPIPLVLLIGIPSSFYYISRPYQLLLLMVFLIPFNFVFKIGSVPVAAELLKVFAWIPFFVFLWTRKQTFKTSRYNWCFAVLGGLLVLSVLRSNDLPFTVKESVRLGSNIGLCYLVSNLVDTREKVIQVFKVLAASAFLVACYGFYQFAIQDFGALFWIVNPRLDTTLAPGRDTFWLWRNRMISVLTSEMEMGHYFNLCIPVGVVLWMTEGRKRISSRWWWMTLAMLTGLLLTFTFGAWLALAATVSFFVLLFDRKQRWKVALAGALILVLAATLLIVGPLRPIMEDKALGAGIGSLAWDVFFRLDGWLFAWDTWRSHPLLGVGIGNFQILQLDHDLIHSDWAPGGSSPHQTYLYLLVQFGLVGFCSVLIVMLSSIRTSLTMRTNSEWRLPAFALSFALTTNMFGWFSDDSSFFGPHASYLVWLFLGLSETIRDLAVARCRITA